MESSVLQSPRHGTHAIPQRQSSRWRTFRSGIPRCEYIPPQVLAPGATPQRWVANASVAVVLQGRNAVLLNTAIRPRPHRGPPASPAPPVPLLFCEEHGKSCILTLITHWLKLKSYQRHVRLSTSLRGISQGIRGERFYFFRNACFCQIPCGCK